MVQEIWLAAKAQRFHRQCYILGLDMFQAFKPPERSFCKWCLRLSSVMIYKFQMPMHNTRLEVKVGNQLTPGFETTICIGCPQGDSQTLVPYTCYLEASLKELRSHVNSMLSCDHDQLVRTSPRYSTESSDVSVTIQPPSSVNSMLSADFPNQ